MNHRPTRPTEQPPTPDQTKKHKNRFSSLNIDNTYAGYYTQKHKIATPRLGYPILIPSVVITELELAEQSPEASRETREAFATLKTQITLYKTSGYGHGTLLKIQGILRAIYPSYYIPLDTCVAVTETEAFDGKRYINTDEVCYTSPSATRRPCPQNDIEVAATNFPHMERYYRDTYTYDPNSPSTYDSPPIMWGTALAPRPYTPRAATLGTPNGNKTSKTPDRAADRRHL